MKNNIRIVGVGNSECGDDGIGPRVALDLAACGPGVSVSASDDALWRLVEGTETADLLIIVDAAEMSSFLQPGEWCTVRFPEDDRAIGTVPLRDTHRLNIDLILRLGRELGTLPKEVWIYAMAGRNFSAGDPLSSPVAEAIPYLETAIEKAIHNWLVARRPADDSVRSQSRRKKKAMMSS